jgi:hypothetical protein
MTTIVFDKTWNAEDYLTTVQTTGANTNKTIIYNIKRIMKNHNWTVVASSNSITADTNDNWNSIADIICATAGSIHSWIVLKNTAIASNFQVCFDMSNATTSNMTCAVSYSSGFSGGTTTARPTATDEAVILNNAQWAYTSSDTSNNYSITMFYSSDYKCNRIYFSPLPYGSEGIATNLFIFDVPKDPVSWWDEQWIAGVSYKISTYANLCTSTTNNKIYTRINGTRCDLSLGSWGTTVPYGTTDQGSSVDHNGAYILSPIPLLSLTAARTGFAGLLYDAYWAGDQVAHGTYINTASGSKKLFVCNNIAFANDGSNRMR